MRKRVSLVVITVLAALVLSLAVQSQLRSEPPAEPQFTGVQFLPYENGWWFFDTRTGDIWIYDQERKLALSHWRLRSLGGPIEQVRRPEADSVKQQK